MIQVKHSQRMTVFTLVSQNTVQVYVWAGILIHSLTPAHTLLNVDAHLDGTYASFWIDFFKRFVCDVRNRLGNRTQS